MIDSFSEVIVTQKMESQDQNPQGNKTWILMQTGQMW